MVFQGVLVGFLGADFDAFEDVEDDAGEAGFVEKDFLVVGYLSYVAGYGCELEVLMGDMDGGTNLTSWKFAGNSTVMAPPYRGVALYWAMFSMLTWIYVKASRQFYTSQVL